MVVEQGSKPRFSEKEFEDAVKRAVEKFMEYTRFVYRRRRFSEPDYTFMSWIERELTDYLTKELGGYYLRCDEVEYVQGNGKRWNGALIITCRPLRKYKKAVTVAIPVNEFGFVSSSSSYYEEYGGFEPEDGVTRIDVSRTEEPKIKIGKHVEPFTW